MAIHIRRREFIVTLGSAVTWPLAARAQQHAKIARIGFLGLAPASVFRTRLDALRAGLREVGLIEGKNIEIEFRWADSMDQLPELAADLVGMNVRSHP
jgi:putative ABC transport system substrate-binding protein